MPEDLDNFFYIETEDFNNGQTAVNIKKRREFNKKLFSKRELEILEKVAEIFKEATGDQMTDSTHLHNSPWRKTLAEKGRSALIDYTLAFDDEDNSLSEEDYKERIELDKKTKELLAKLSN